MEHCKYLENQYLNERTADIYFVIDIDEQPKIPAHKAILAANSKLLEKRLNENIDLKKIEIVNVTPAALKEFLFAFYSKYPEKKFTIANAYSVLCLATIFDVGFCIKTCEQFLVKNLPIDQICFGYCVAKEFKLIELKSHCMKQINTKKGEAFTSQSFFSVSLDVLNDILKNVTITKRAEIKLVWDACMCWAEAQCVKQSIDASDMKNRRRVLGKCFQSIHAIVSKDGEFHTYAVEHYKDLFNSNALANTQATALLCKRDENQNETKTIGFAHLRETMLSTQLCSAKDTNAIELQSTKRLILKGIAFSTAIGMPKGTLSVGIHSDDPKLSPIIQEIRTKQKHCEHKHFVPIENVVLEPHQRYTIKVELSKDVVYYRSRTVLNQFYDPEHDFTVSFFKLAGRDIFSHFFFSL